VEPGGERKVRKGEPYTKSRQKFNVEGSPESKSISGWWKELVRKKKKKNMTDLRGGLAKKSRIDLITSAGDVTYRDVQVFQTLGQKLEKEGKPHKIFRVVLGYQADVREGAVFRGTARSERETKPCKPAVAGALLLRKKMPEE